MDHKILSEMGDHLEGLGILTVEELKRRLSTTVTTQPDAVSAPATIVVPKSKYIQQCYSVSVPRRTLAEAIKAGKYDWANSDVNEKNFPTDDTCFGDKDMALFRFNKSISSENAVKKMDAEGYRPATLMELLAFGEKYPNLQREFPIIALGSSVGFGHARYVPELWFGRVGGRGLSLGVWAGDWRSGCRFLAVRK